MRDASYFRSQEYQWKLMEVPVDHDFFRTYSSNYSELDPVTKEQLSELRERLFQRVIILAKQGLTEKQFKILQMYFLESKTQVEIAKVMNIQQNTVCKSLIGSPYTTKDGKSHKKGSPQKLKEILLQDQETIDILNQIQEIS